MAAFGGAELREGAVVVDREKLDLDRHPDTGLFSWNSNEVGNDTSAFFEFDQHDGIGVLEGRDLGVVGDDKAVDNTSPTGFDRVPVERLAVGAHGAGWVPQYFAALAALDQQFSVPGAVPEELVVLVDAGPGARPRVVLTHSFVLAKFSRPAVPWLDKGSRISELGSRRLLVPITSMWAGACR